MGIEGSIRRGKAGEVWFSRFSSNWSYTSTIQYVFMSWCLTEHTDFAFMFVWFEISPLPPPNAVSDFSHDFPFSPTLLLFAFTAFYLVGLLVILVLLMVCFLGGWNSIFKMPATLFLPPETAKLGSSTEVQVGPVWKLWIGSNFRVKSLQGKGGSKAEMKASENERNAQREKDRKLDR
jgi:hypothetical protein